MNQGQHLQVKENIPDVYMTAEPTLNTSTIPGSKAYPLNQGFSYTCTHHAIANAVADQLADKHIDIDQKSFAGILISNTGSIGPIWPHFFDNYHIPVLSMNETNKKWISVKINIVREVKEFSNTGKYVLAYHTKEILPDGTWKWGEYHCVFVKQQSENHYVCVNSWGDRDKYPEVELNRPGNRLWIVSAEFQFAQGGPPGSGKPNNIPPKNGIYMKLDFIRIKYIKEYKEKSSQEFKEIVSDIKQEVGNICSSIEGYGNTEGYEFWEGSNIVDGKENNQNVLSAKLFVRMNPDKSINLLRKEITSGRLGKFEVVSFPDKFAATVGTHTEPQNELQDITKRFAALTDLEKESKEENGKGNKNTSVIDGCTNDFGKSQLSQKMKDYLAKNISFDVWKKILRSSLPDEAENVIHAITSSRRREPYDRSYAAIRKLVETDIVTNASRMETLVKRFHVTEAKKFGKIFLEGKPARYGGMTLSAAMNSFISERVGIQWKRFARNLEIDDYVIDEIDVNENNVTLEDKCMAIINECGKVEELTWDQVKDVLTEIDLVNVASAFEKKYLGKSTVN